jgi:predicted permease
VITGNLGLRERSYPDAPSRIAFYERLLGELRQTPAVAGAVLSSPSPLTEFEPAAILADAAGTAPPSIATFRTVTPGYFALLGVPIRTGRDFLPTDRAGAEPVAILSESAAARLWPRQDALGRRIRVLERMPSTWDTVSVVRVVVGVVRDVRHAPADSVTAEVYLPLYQLPARFLAMVVRGDQARPWLAELRGVLRRVDAEVPVSAVRALPEVLDEQLARPRFLAALFTGFGGFAMLLALIGVYGVIAYAARQREHEIAVRLAVGAAPAAIRRLFLREGALLLGVGLALGVPGALAVGRLLRAQLFGVAPLDIGTLLAAGLGLGAAGLAAIWWPCLRASTTDPVIVLREE